MSINTCSVTLNKIFLNSDLDYLYSLPNPEIETERLKHQKMSENNRGIITKDIVVAGAKQYVNITLF